MKKITYPVWRYHSKPTRSELLQICDACKVARWTTDTPYALTALHDCKDGNRRRWRRGTPKEKEEALDALEHDDIG